MSFIASIRNRYSNLYVTEKWILLSCLFSLALMLTRVMYTGTIYYLFLVWNLFLAYVPYAITNALRNRPDWLEKRWLFIIVTLLWLLFIPNSFYLITDLFHLEPDLITPYWFDLILLMSFAWNGILLGVLSVRLMEQLFRIVFEIRHEGLFLYPVLWLNAFGVYVGRYLRFNSWDVLTDPFALASDIGYLIIHPFRNGNAWAMVICFSVFMYFIYQGIKALSHSFQQS